MFVCCLLSSHCYGSSFCSAGQLSVLRRLAACPAVYMLYILFSIRFPLTYSFLFLVGPPYWATFQLDQIQSCHREKISWYLVSIFVSPHVFLQGIAVHPKLQNDSEFTKSWDCIVKAFRLFRPSAVHYKLLPPYAFEQSTWHNITSHHRQFLFLGGIIFICMGLPKTDLDNLWVIVAPYSHDNRG